jgi:hypothetical protein
MTLVLIDPPSPFDTLATWQRHLADVRRSIPAIPNPDLQSDNMQRATIGAARRHRRRVSSRL